MAILESKFIIYCVLFTGVILGALFGFWTTLGMVIASHLAILAYRYYVSGKIKDKTVSETDSVPA